MLSNIQLDAAFAISCPTSSPAPESGSPGEKPLSCREAKTQQQTYFSTPSAIFGHIDALVPWWQNPATAAGDGVDGTFDETTPTSPFAPEKHLTNILKRDALFNYLDLEVTKVDESVNSSSSSTDDALSAVFDVIDSDDESSVAFDDCVSATSTSTEEGHFSSNEEDTSIEPAVPASIEAVAHTAAAAVPLAPKFAATSNDHASANSKNRVVDIAQRLVTDDEDVQTELIPKWFPFEGASDAIKVRMIRVYNNNNHGAARTIGFYVHAADLGSVIERKSNISRLFGKFDSPSEKLLLRVVGSHNHTKGQESNVLTAQGIKRFLTIRKMLDAPPGYGEWVLNTLLPAMGCEETSTAVTAVPVPGRPLATAAIASRVVGKKRSTRSKYQDDDESYTSEAKRQKGHVHDSFV